MKLTVTMELKTAPRLVIWTIQKFRYPATSGWEFSSHGFAAD
jgi:hypothetical protein